MANGETLPKDVASLQKLYDELDAQGAAFNKGRGGFEQQLIELVKKARAERETQRAALVQRKGRVFQALLSAKETGAVEKVAEEVLNEPLGTGVETTSEAEAEASAPRGRRQK